MSVEIPAIAGGAIVGAVATEAFQKGKDSAGNALFGEKPEHGPIEMEMLVHSIARIEEMVRCARDEISHPLERTVQLTNSEQNQPVEFHLKGYKHVSLFTTTAFSMTVRSKVGIAAFNIGIGWNGLHLPENSIMWIGAGGPAQLNVILYYSDELIDIPGAAV